MASTLLLKARVSCLMEEMGGCCGAPFVMLINWPNLNDPDICWFAVSSSTFNLLLRHKKQIRPLKLGRMTVSLMMYGSKGKSFYLCAWTREIIGRREPKCILHMFMCTNVQHPPATHTPTQKTGHARVHVYAVVQGAGGGFV